MLTRFRGSSADAHLWICIGFYCAPRGYRDIPVAGFAQA